MAILQLFATCIGGGCLALGTIFGSIYALEKF